MQANKIDIEYFLDITAYEVFSNGKQTIIIKIFNHAGQLVSFKYRVHKGVKWSVFYGTKPNKITVKRLVDSNAPVFIVEGHRDALTAILMGINFIAVPTVTYTEFDDIELTFLKDKELVFIPDIDGSKSVEGMTKLLNQCDGIAKSLSIIDLRNIYKSENIPTTKDKFDLSELVEDWIGDLNGLKSVLAYSCESEGIF